MSNQYIIEHSGMVIASGADTISVMIEKDDCHSCKLKEFCGVTDAERNTFEIDTASCGSLYKKGDKVKLTIANGVGYEALFWAYLAPFFIVVLTIVFLLSVGLSDIWSGTVSLFILLPYYYGLSKSKKGLTRRLQLQIFKDE